MRMFLDLLLCRFVAFAFPVFLVAAPGMGEPLYSVDGKEKSSKDLSPATLQNLFDIEMQKYRQVQSVLEADLLQQYFEEQATKQKKSAAEVEAAELNSKAPSDSEVKKFYEQNKSRIPPGYTYENVKPEIVKMLAGQAAGEKRRDLIEKVKKNKKFKYLVPEPVAPKVEIKTEGFAFVGSASAKAHLIEFADYQCPHCRETAKVVERLKKQFGDKLLFTFIDFPINPSGISLAVAEGGFCVRQQDPVKYWKYHEEAFKDSNLTKDSPKVLAKKVGVDEAAFSKCAASAEAKAFVAKSKEEGERIGVSGTPSLYINGVRYSGAHEFDPMKKALESAMK